MLRSVHLRFVDHQIFLTLPAPTARPKKPEGGRHGIPPLKPLLPCRPTPFLRL